MDAIFVDEHEKTLERLYKNLTVLNQNLNQTFQYASDEPLDYDKRSRIYKWVLWLFIIYFVAMVALFILFPILEFNGEKLGKKILGIKSFTTICAFLFTFLACTLAVIYVGYSGLGTGLCRYSKNSFTDKTKLTQVAGE